MCESNHQFREIGYFERDYFGTATGEVLTKALDINARSKYGISVNQRVRSELCSIYFQGYCNVQSFFVMDTVLMPKVLELVTLKSVHTKLATTMTLAVESIMRCATTI